MPDIINLQVTFEMDSAGVLFSRAEPPHLDALVCRVLVPLKLGDRRTSSANPDDPLEEITLPIPMARINGSEVYRASALFPDGDIESIRYWRKRFRQDRAELTTGSPNLTNSTYKEYNMPMVINNCRYLVGWMAAYSIRDIKALLRKVRYIGKKSAQGLGRVISVTVEPVNDDYALTRDGAAMRYYPHEQGWKSVRPTPPYWHNSGRVLCLAPGDAIE